MPHEVGKEGDVVEAVKEVLGETVTERVWINHITVKTVLFGKVLQLDGYATSVLKTEDIHPPKTGISVHFSGSLV